MAVIVYPLVSAIAILAFVFVVVNVGFAVSRVRAGKPKTVMLAPWAVDEIRRETNLAGLLIVAAFGLWVILVVAANHEAYESHAEVTLRADIVEWSPRNPPRREFPDFSPSIERRDRLRK